MGHIAKGREELLQFGGFGSGLQSTHEKLLHFGGGGLNGCGGLNDIPMGLVMETSVSYSCKYIG